MKNLLILVFMTCITFSCVTGRQIKDSKPVVEEAKPYVTPDIFSAKSSLKWVNELSKSTNCVSQKESFQEAVKKIEKFDYSTANGEQVLKDLLKHKCKLRTYKTRNPWSIVYATTYTSNKTDIYLNLRKNPRKNIATMINSSIHECLHNAGYSHGDNKIKNNTKKKLNSVNYKIGKIAEENSEGCF